MAGSLDSPANDERQGGLVGGRGEAAGNGGVSASAGPSDSDGVGPERYASCAWRLVGLFRSQAGWLDLHDGRLRYFTPAGVDFDVPLDEVTGLVFPWYYSGGGLKLTVAGEEYRFAFVEPNGAQRPDVSRLAASKETRSLAQVAVRAQEAGSGRSVGREWRRLLEGTTAS
jgi:hypothetical protein